MRYRVTVLRHENIEFELEADSVEDAQARYLADGDEVSSETALIDVIDTEEIS